jgi:hypothetical protein
MTLAELRGAKPPSIDAVNALASSLAGFSESVVDQACETLENAPRGEYEAAMPTLAMLMDACRTAARVKVPGPEWGFYACGRCKTTYAATQTPTGGCRACGALSLIQTKAPEPEFNHAAYMADVRLHPERYVRVADVIREVMEKRRREGKSLGGFSDPRMGEA